MGLFTRKTDEQLENELRYQQYQEASRSQVRAKKAKRANLKEEIRNLKYKRAKKVVSAIGSGARDLGRGAKVVLKQAKKTNRQARKKGGYSIGLNPNYFR